MDIFLEYVDYMKTDDIQSTYLNHPILTIWSTVVEMVTYVLILSLCLYSNSWVCVEEKIFKYSAIH